MCQCRICLEEVDVEDRKKYCNCSGSNGYVHFECLEKWIRGNNFKDECEICKSKYRFNYVPLYPGILTIEFSCLLVVLLASIIICVLVWDIDSDMNSKKQYILWVKDSTLYLPIILSQVLKIKYNSSRKVLSYKLEYINEDEQTPLIESGQGYETINEEESERSSLSFNSSLEGDQAHLICD